MKNSMPKKRSKLGTIWFRFKKNKTAMIGLIVIVALLLMTLFVSVFCDYSKAITNDVPNKFQLPSAEHPFGTDALGRDIMWRTLFGARISLLCGLASVLLGMLVGTAIGAVSGYYGHIIDNVLMRVMDVLLAIPSILLCIAIVSAWGGSILNLIIALAIALVPNFARIVRSAIMSVKSMDYIEAAHAYGASNFHIIMKHIIPNAMAPAIVSATLAVGAAILGIAGLSYLGLGVAPPTPEWGYILSEAQSSLRYYPYLIIAPGLALMLTVMAFNLFGDGLRDALDPKLKN